MLSKPRYGWTNVTIGEFQGRASYLTDVPMDCLISFINSFKYGIPASVFFDEEGSTFTLVTESYNNTYIISEREDTELININKRFLDLAKELIKDIEDNLEDWVFWEDYYDDSEDTLNKRRKLINDRLEKLKELVFIDKEVHN